MSRSRQSNQLIIFTQRFPIYLHSTIHYIVTKWTGITTFSPSCIIMIILGQKYFSDSWCWYKINLWLCLVQWVLYLCLVWRRWWSAWSSVWSQGRPRGHRPLHTVTPTRSLSSPPPPPLLSLLSQSLPTSHSQSWLLSVSPSDSILKLENKSKLVSSLSF